MINSVSNSSPIGPDDRIRSTAGVNSGKEYRGYKRTLDEDRDQAPLNPHAGGQDSDDEKFELPSSKEETKPAKEALGEDSTPRIPEQLGPIAQSSVYGENKKVDKDISGSRLDEMA